MTLEAGAPVLLASVSEESDDAIRVLLIEDGVIDREFLTDTLSRQGFSVRTVASLAAAARDADVALQGSTAATFVRSARVCLSQ